STATSSIGRLKTGSGSATAWRTSSSCWSRNARGSASTSASAVECCADQLRRTVEILRARVLVGVLEVQIRLAVDGDHVEMGVGDLHAGDDQADAGGGEHGLLRAADLASDPHQMAGEVRVEVDPVVDLGDRHHQRVSGPDGRD